MKLKIAAAFFSLLIGAYGAQAVGDLKLSQMTNAVPPSYSDRFITPYTALPTILGTNASKVPVPIKLGANLSFDAGTNTLNASGSLTAVAWGQITGTLTDQADLVAALALKANLASPALTGIPTAPTASPGTSTTQLATTAFVTAATGSGITITGTPANLQAAEWSGASSLRGVATTGTGIYVKATGPTLITPILGVAAATSINGLTITSSTGTLTVASGKVLTASNTLTLAGTDGSTLNVGAGGTLGTAAFQAASSFEVPLSFTTGLTRTTNTISVNTSQNIAKLSNLTSNGFVKTSSGDGTLSVDTATYISASSPTITTPTFVTYIVLPSSASPSTASIGRMAFKSSAWAAGLGAIQVQDGTGPTLLVGVQAGDTPATGDIPTFQSNGTITWEPGTGATAAAKYIVQTPDAGLPNAQSLSALNTGIVKNTTITGVLSIINDSTLLRAVISDPTGTGALVFANTPTLITPVLGVATATTINKVTLTAPATGSTLTIADGKTFTVNSTLTFSGTDGTSFVFPATSGTFVTLDGFETLTNKTLTAPTINGGFANSLAGLSLRSTGAAFDLTLATAEVMTAGRQLNIVMGDANRTMTLGGNVTTGGLISTAGDLTTSGAFALTLTQTGATNVTLPTTGTLATLAGSESLSNKTLVSPIFTTSIVLPNGASPTTSSVGNLAFNTTAWAASRGALQLTDGTATTYVIAVLASDTPVNGQTLQFNTGGTITWETPAGGGTVTHSTSALTPNAIVLGNGGGDVLPLGSLGTTTTILHGNAAGAPTFSAVSLTADVTGTLPVASGGLGLASLTAYAPIFGGTTGTGAVQSGAVGSAGQVLTSNGPGAIATFQASSAGTPGGSNTQLQYNNSSAFGGISGATTNGTAVTYTAANLIATSPKFITDISDTNGNEIFKITATASAVNEFTISNAASGNSPTLSATGSGTDININLTPKGVGGIVINGTKPIIYAEASGTTNENYLIFRPTNANTNGAIGIAPVGSATESAIFLFGNSTVTTSGSNLLAFGGGVTGAIAGSWNFASVNVASVNSASRPFSFVVSNVADGRVETVRLLNTGQVDVKRNITSSSTTTGSLTVAGGAGVVGAAYVGSLNVTGTTITKLRHGTTTLVAGTVTVTDTATTTSTRIFINRFTDGGTLGDSYSVTRSAGASFTVTSKTANITQALDTSVLAYECIEP